MRSPSIYPYKIHVKNNNSFIKFNKYIVIKHIYFYYRIKTNFLHIIIKHLYNIQVTEHILYERKKDT